MSVDAGGSWVGPTQTAVLGLLDAFGLSVVSQHADGLNLLRMRGRTYRYRGDIPRLGLAALLDLARAQRALDRMAQRLGPPPWPEAATARLDAETLGGWMRRRVHTAASRGVLAAATAASFGCRPEALSLLGFAVHVSSAGTLADLIGVHGGALKFRIAEGAAALPTRLARTLGDRVHLDHPITRIRRREGGAILTSDDQPPVSCRRVVIAVDPATAHAITHEPPPPAARAELERRWQMGSGIKAHAIYDRPWWRDLGLSGTAVTDTGTTRVTFDVSPTNAGVLTAFIGLPLIDDPSLLDPDATTRRRRQVLDDLAAFYGPSARQPDDYVEKDWATEPWHSGCLPRPPTGLLSRYNRG